MWQQQELVYLQVVSEVLSQLNQLLLQPFQFCISFRHLPFQPLQLLLHILSSSVSSCLALALRLLFNAAFQAMYWQKRRNVSRDE